MNKKPDFIKDEKRGRKIVILQHDGGEFANQLWHYISILAYALEKGYDCVNTSFFEYARSFEGLSEKNPIVRLFSLPYINRFPRKSSRTVRLWRFLYKLLMVKSIEVLQPDRFVYSNDSPTDPYYLPPTASSSVRIQMLEDSGCVFNFAGMNGGVFRNPVGLQKHREAIVEHIRPLLVTQEKIRDILVPLRAAYKKIVAVHVRQTDYKTFKGGKYFVNPERVSVILREYVAESGLNASEICFTMTSDERIDQDLFKGLNVVLSRNDVVTDTFLLASCDAIIGSDSTLGHFAAYYGNIPHIIMKNERMDWAYYRNAHKYFQNKYLSVMLY